MDMTKSIRMRLYFTKRMQDAGFSANLTCPIHHHIAKMEREQGDKMIQYLQRQITQGATEDEIREAAVTEFGVDMSK